MPFKSKSQMKAAFAGALGPEMKSKAKEWADKTPNLKRLPEHALKGLKRSKPHKASDAGGG